MKFENPSSRHPGMTLAGIHDAVLIAGPRLTIRRGGVNNGLARFRPRGMTIVSTFFLASWVYAQGILPPKPKSNEESAPRPSYLLISEKIPDTLTVIDAQGVKRPLLSYKTNLDVLVVGFYSPSCLTNQALWPALERFYNEYKGWHVSFVAVNSNPDVSLSDVTAAMAKAGLPYPAVQDENQKVAKALNAKATPEIMIIDESGYLRYRGPLNDVAETPGKRPHKFYAKDALKNLIGNIDTVHDVEPSDFIGCPIQL